MMKIFFVLLILYTICFVTQCHFTISYLVFPFLLMLPMTEMLELHRIQKSELRSSLTDLHTHFHKRYTNLGRTIVGTYTILTVWMIYLLRTLETCSVEMSLFTVALMALLGAWYGIRYLQFRGVRRTGLL